jgi:O-succinylbenzoate synthase
MEKESEQIHPFGMVNKVRFFKEQFGELTIKHWNLDFKRPARTSRDVLTQHHVCYVFLHDSAGSVIARGEIAPIIGLSTESWDDVEKAIQSWMNGEFQDIHAWPSAVKAAVDMLWQDLFPSSIPKLCLINGLVWMNEVEAMFHEAMEKYHQGFRCIKLKVGSLDFADELSLIQSLRSRFGSDVVIRLDANGAWKLEEAISKLEALSQWNIHSIEQPIAANQWESMRFLSEHSPIPIALDEELIGREVADIDRILAVCQPEYLVIKPSLHGGFDMADEWIRAAQKRGIDWWATSALESNVGLSHIYRWLGNYQNDLPQGLGTGHLYTNNWDCPLQLNGQIMGWNAQQSWRAPWN